MMIDRPDFHWEFHRDILLLVAELTHQGPSFSLEAELESRAKALRAFWDRWIAHSRVGYPVRARLEALELAVIEPGWLGRFTTTTEAVNYLRQCVRGRSRRIDAIEIKPEMVVAPALEQPIAPGKNLSDIEMAYLVGRLDGNKWGTVADRLGHDRAEWRRHQYSLKKKFEDLRSCVDINPKKVRAFSKPQKIGEQHA